MSNSINVEHLDKKRANEAIEAVKKSLNIKMQETELQLSAAAWLVTAEAIN
jgi:ribosomal protein L31E